MAVIKIKPILVHVNASNIIAHVIFNIYRDDEWGTSANQNCYKETEPVFQKRLLESDKSEDDENGRKLHRGIKIKRFAGMNAQHNIAFRVSKRCSSIYLQKAKGGYN